MDAQNRLGYFRETGNDRVMEKVDEQGNVLGFSLMRISTLGNRPLAVALAPKVGLISTRLGLEADATGGTLRALAHTPDLFGAAR